MKIIQHSILDVGVVVQVLKLLHAVVTKTATVIRVPILLGLWTQYSEV